MIPAAFSYHSPRSLAEATNLLAQYGDDAKVLSGGQSHIPLLKLRLARRASVYGASHDIGRVQHSETRGQGYRPDNNATNRLLGTDIPVRAANSCLVYFRLALAS